MRTLMSRIARLARDERGSAGMMFTLSLVPSLMVVGGAVDYGKALAEKARLQAAADAATVAGASPVGIDASERHSIALKVFTANVRSANLNPSISASSNEVSVDVSTSVKTPFLAFANIPSLTTVAYSKAYGNDTVVSSNNAGKLCLLALDPSSDDGIHLQGDNHVNYLNCWSHTNSTKPTAINANGNNAKANGAGHCAVGGYTQTHDTFSPTPKTGCLNVPDPFADVGAYEVSAYSPKFTPPTKVYTCKANNLNLKKGTFTLDPGRYCGGINIQAHATVTFNEGIYYIDNGVLNVQSGSSVTGDNVVFYLEGAASKMTVIGGGTVDLKGRHKNHSYAGFLAIAHPNANPMGESNIQGGGTFKMQGVVYMPKQRIEVSGNGDVNNASITVFGMVAKDFYFRGNGVFNAPKHNGANANTDVPDIMPTLPEAQIRKTVLK